MFVFFTELSTSSSTFVTAELSEAAPFIDTLLPVTEAPAAGDSMDTLGAVVSPPPPPPPPPLAVPYAPISQIELP